MTGAQICNILQRKVLCVAIISICLHVIVFYHNVLIFPLVGLVTSTLLCCGVTLRWRCLLYPFMLNIIAYEFVLVIIFIVFICSSSGPEILLYLAVLLMFILLLGWILRTTIALNVDITNDNERVAGITNCEEASINHRHIIDRHRHIINEIIEHQYIPALQSNGDNFPGSNCGEVGLETNGTDAQHYIPRILLNSLNENVDNPEYAVEPRAVYHEASTASIATIDRQDLPPSYEEAMAKIFHC